MGWIISPSQGVENYNNGSFNLPCSESNVTYSITYVNSEGCSSNTVTYTYVTSGSCDSPTPVCPVQSSIINTNTTVANSGGTQVEVMQILKDSTYTTYTITATSTSSSYVSNINEGSLLHDNWYAVLADVTANPDTSDRSLYFDVVVKGPTLGTGCTYSSVTVTQKEGCPTQSSIINTTTTVANSGGTQVEVMRILKDSTYTAYTITATSTSSSYVSNINEGAHLHDNWYVVLADVTANPNTSDRPLYFDVIAEGPTLGTGCTYSGVTVTQKGGCPTDFIKPFDTTVGEGGGYCIALGRFKNNLTGYGTAFTVTVSDGETMSICQTTSPWDQDASWNLLQINVPQNTSENSRTITITCTLTKGSSTCSESIEIVQSGATQTCGCNSITVNGTYEADPTPVTEQFKVKIQIHNATNNTIYWDVIDFNFADGNEESPETCDSCQDNTTKTWNYGGSSSHDDWVLFVGYTTTDTPTLSSALINLTDSSCNTGAGVKTLTTTQTTWHNGDTILLQYNG